MICARCGQVNIDEAKFCIECGASLLTEKEESSSLEEDVSLEQEPVLDPQKTGELELPHVFEEDIAADIPSFDEFDFDAIELEDVDLPKDDPSEDVSFEYDTSGFDEYLVDPGYVKPKKSWKSGDTVEMPRVEGDEPPKKTDFRAPETKEKKGRGKIALIAGIVAILLLALVAAGVSYQMEMWGGKSLPDVEGMNVTQATETLEASGFVVKVMKVKSDDQEDKVLLMDPSAGRRLSEGSEVVLQVATPRIIPEVVGLPLEEAQESLTTEGFKTIEVVNSKSNEAEGTVLSMEPEAGQKAKASTVITITVAESYVVPDTIGKGMSDARALLEGEGYIVNEYYVYSDEAEYTILSTDPDPGTKLASGSEVTMTIAKSRGAELVAATQSQMDGIYSLSAENDNEYYAIQYKGEPYYIGDGVTQVPITVVLTISSSVGDVVIGSPEDRTLTFVWNDDNSLQSYY